MKVVLSWVIVLTLLSEACGVAEGPVEFAGTGSGPGLRALDDAGAGGAGGEGGAAGAATD